MVVYITATTMSMLLAYISTHINKSRYLKDTAKRVLPSFFAILSVLPLMLVMAFRHGVGTDFWIYVRTFEYGDKRMEEGYALLNKLVHCFSDDYHGIFIVSSIIICSCYFYIIYKESTSPAYSILLFVLCRDYFIAMNGMRQYISTAIVILAIPLVKRKEWIKAAAIFVIAFLFHRSIIIFLLMLALYFINIKPVLGAGMIVGMFVLSNTAISFILPILQRFGFYSVYFLNRSGYRNDTGDFNWTYTLIFISFFIMLAYEYNNVKQSKELKLMYSAVLTSLIVMSLSSVMPTNVQRLTWHMNSLLVLYTPLAVKSIHDKKIEKALEVAIPLAFAIVYIPKIINGNQDVLPYHTIWF